MERDGEEVTNIKKYQGRFYFLPKFGREVRSKPFWLSSDRRFWLDVVEPDEPPQKIPNV
jgi:hypothetical protein